MFRQWPDCGAGLRLCKKYALRRKPGRRRLPSSCPPPARLSSCSRIGRGAKRAARLIPFPQGSAVKAQVTTGRGGPCACMRASPAQAASSPHPLRGRQGFFSRPIFYDMLRTAKTCLRISAAKKNVPETRDGRVAVMTAPQGPAASLYFFLQQDVFHECIS